MNRVIVTVEKFRHLQNIVTILKQAKKDGKLDFNYEIDIGEDSKGSMIRVDI